MSEAQEKLTRLEALNDEDLLERAWAELSALCGSEGRPKKWTMTIPVDADRDSDILFGEVLKRYEALKRELRKKTQHVCSHCGYVTVSQDVEEAFASLKDEIRRHEEVFQFSANKIAALKRENERLQMALGEFDDALLAAEEQE